MKYITVIKRIYTIYGILVFGLIFFILFVPLLIPLLFEKQSHWLGRLNRTWSKLLFFFIAIPWQREYRSFINPKRRYIFCPNHSSWLDIPTMGLNKHNTLFVGKSEIAGVPLFGWMYKKLHISIDRKQLNSMRVMLKRASMALDKGKSLCIFPEGGIRSKTLPKMAPLKEGAFRLAIQQQIPIVPVTIPNNWIILPTKPMLLTWKEVKIIFHEPINVVGMDESDIDALKKKVFDTIDEELKRHNTPLI